MHELSLAQALVEELEAVLRRDGAAGVASVRIAIGAVSGVMREAFEFAWPVVSEGTGLQGARLEVEEIPLTLRCRDCGAEGEAPELLLLCPRCDSLAVDVLAGKELKVKSMEVW